MNCIRCVITGAFVALIGIGGLTAQTSTYDAIGRLVWSAQPGGASTTYAYDPNGNLTATGSVGAGADGDGDGIADYYEIRFTGTVAGLVATGDEEGDGLTNLREFAFGRDPRQSDSSNLTPVSIEPPTGANQYFTLRYNRPKSAPLLLAYSAEVSFDLVTWDNTVTAVEQTGVTDLGNGLEQVTVRALSPVSVQPRIFIRVRITKL
jgi:YD repeat-containing protein